MSEVNVPSVPSVPFAPFGPPDSSEDRAKHRARLHLGENRTSGMQNNRDRGGGFERSRGRGVRRQPQQFYTRPDKERERPPSPPSPTSPKLAERKPEEPLNWADEVDREIERQAQLEAAAAAAASAAAAATSTHPKSKTQTVANGADGITDLRQKLNAMRLEREEQTHQLDKSDEAPFGGRNGDHGGHGGHGGHNGHGGNGRRWQQNKNQRNHGTNGKQSAAGNLTRPKKNTENFDPSYDPPEMRILCAREGLSKYGKPCSTRDVIVVNDLFCKPDDYTLYKQILLELEQSGVTAHQLWQLWHGDSHVIADDKRKWKQECPTFMKIIDKIADYFDMDVKATRLNWYRDSTEWKPFHHDAAAVKADKAHTQNFTVAVSFGMERDAAFEHAKTKTIISMPQPNGTIYTFGRDVNILWRHGIPQIPPEKHSQEGRISIIAWGWIPQFDL